MLISVKDIYSNYDKSFTSTSLSKDYLDLYDKAISFVYNQPDDFTAFDHFTFIKDYVNLLSKNVNDYTLNDSCSSIFDKSLYDAQNTKGIYLL